MSFGKNRFNDNRAPGPGGLYRSDWEHDACGVALVARLSGEASREIVEQGLEILRRLEHRGAVSWDGKTGDGSGLSVQLPLGFVRRVFPGLTGCGREQIAVGTFFLAPDKVPELQALCEAESVGEGYSPAGWRDVPIGEEAVGEIARNSMPAIYQLALKYEAEPDREKRERQLYFLRRKLEGRAIRAGYGLEDFYISSLSSQLLVYKGMFRGSELKRAYPDLSEPDFCSAFALVHQRYSTNTLPQWYLAQPLRLLAHNGEINTIRHNIDSFSVGEFSAESPVYGARLPEILPALQKGVSDSVNLDNALEFFLRNGRGLAHSIAMLVPEPFSPESGIPEPLKDFYSYHSRLMEPWDGPAALIAADGTEIVAALDRNGLRPARFTITRDDRLVVASEAGVLPIPPGQILQQGKLSPGKMLYLNLESRTLLFDQDIKTRLSAQAPYRDWLSEGIQLEGLQRELREEDLQRQPLERDRFEALLRNFVYGYEELRDVLKPMAERSEEPVGSMANPVALAALLRPAEAPEGGESFYNYFRQSFAQVTNPPIDPYRESVVMSLKLFLGPRENVLAEDARHMRKLELAHPVFHPVDLERLERSGILKVRRLSLCAELPPYFRRRAETGRWTGLSHFPELDGTWLKQALERCLERADSLIAEGAEVLVLSDRDLRAGNPPLPPLLVLGALTGRLMETKQAHRVSIGVESGGLRTVHQIAALIGYGASFAVPYFVFDVFGEMRSRGLLGSGDTLARHANSYIQALKKGLLKVISKMGVSTVQSYQGGKLYQILGLGEDVVSLCFNGTYSPIGGKGFGHLERGLIERHLESWSLFPPGSEVFALDGSERLRRGLRTFRPLPAERNPADARSRDLTEHEGQIITPSLVISLRRAVRDNCPDMFQRYSREADRISRKVNLRGLLRFKSGRPPIPLDQVEPEEAILRRFVSGAMSYGSLSKEAHETIAIAMNRIGARSNSGEGGEDILRYQLLPNGDDRRSRIKQIASGRFGVNSYYLANADELQIKMAQGAKPGEGGQLPGYKISADIARVRCSVPGVTLISPPPHHDIYSIEDLAQLIYDLRAANPQAQISVKLVAQKGVGTVAAGVAKGKANAILISGHDGGTGASPLSSLRHAGSFWELGLAETQQSLIRNRLRSSVRLQCDGQLRTGRDVVIGGLLGADEFGFGTACLISLGCIMMRKCHTNSCPVGIATQDENCRKRFAGSPEHLVRMMRFIAGEVRELMAELGFSRFQDLIGRVDLLEPDQENEVLRENRIDLRAMLTRPAEWENGSRSFECSLEEAPSPLGVELLAACRSSIETQEPFYGEYLIRNSDRAVGATLSYHLSKRFGPFGPPGDLLHLKFRGSAGQSFGAFAAAGLFLELEGESNDYLGKGLSGSRLVLYPHRDQDWPGLPPAGSGNSQESGLLAGNVCLFGATAGSLYIAGQAGERFAVRNSGAVAVVEGIGAHGCEYMTGGRVLVLGSVGMNFGSGMSGGIAYIWDRNRDFAQSCNVSQAQIESLDPVANEVDLRWVREQIETHFSYTSSPVGEYLLENWEDCRTEFVRFVPDEYRPILERAGEDERAGQARASRSR